VPLAAVAVGTTVVGTVLLGHAALAVLLPLALLGLAVSVRRHQRPLPLGLQTLALALAYLHIFGHTPEWQLYVVMGLSFLASLVDWRANRAAACALPARPGAADPALVCTP